MAEHRYDFIVVGAGSAGCVLANRLSENGRWRVLLLEAGPKSHWLSPMPVSFAKLIDNPAANWCYRAEPDEGSGGRTIPIPRGRVLGGSSSINGLVFVRGQRLDYDTWAQLGNRGWGYDDVLPVFQRMEHFERGADEWRSQGGPLRVSEVPDESPLYDALFRAGVEAGLPHNPDYNGENQEGICKTQATISRGRRMSTAHCYLRPARGRANLDVASGALAHRLVLDGKRCTGVRYRRNGREEEALAGREVVLCGGSINSPQLLELSGIGRPAVLGEHGIEVAHELARGGGESHRPHGAAGGVAVETARRDLQRAGTGARPRVAGDPLRDDRRRVLEPPLRPGARLPPEPRGARGSGRPGPLRALRDPGAERPEPPPRAGHDLHRVRPAAGEPGVGPPPVRAIRPRRPPSASNFLSDPLDRRILVDSVRWVRRIIATKAMDDFRDAEMRPGPEVESDDEIVEWIRATAETAFHPVGTCKMGQDPMAVVDERLRVRGMESLRIADGSIMPTLVSGNTNAACIMIGVKASEMMLADAAA